MFRRPRQLGADSLFFAPAGYCLYCQSPLGQWPGESCVSCQARKGRRFKLYALQQQCKKLVKKNGECLRCHTRKRLEVAHMLSVEKMWYRKTYPVMTKHQFAESLSYRWNIKSFDGTGVYLSPLSRINWADATVTRLWRRQIRFNRIWMRQIFDARNLRVFCQGCHDYHHARESLQSELKSLSQYRPDSVRRMLVEARLKALDELNTPELIRKHGYRRYTLVKEARYQYWYKLQKKEWVKEKETVKVSPIPPEGIEYERWDGFQWVPVAKA